MIMQLLKLNRSHKHTSLSHLIVHHYLQKRNVPLIIVKLNTELDFLSFQSREILHICFSWAKWSFLMSVCLTWDCEMLKHSHLKRARWSTIETIPCVIFILNTNYSLPDSLVFVSFYSPFSLSQYLFSFSVFSHTRSQAERFHCLFFNRKKMKELNLIFFFNTQGHCFPNTMSQLLCWIWTSKTVKYWAWDNFSKHMLSCVCVCDCMCEKKLYAVLMSTVIDAQLSGNDTVMY